MYKAAIVGLGQIGLMYDFDPKRISPSSHTAAYQLHPELQLVAAHDVRIQQQTFLKKLAPGTLFYQEIIPMLQTEEIDVISICTPPDQHLQNIKEVLQYSSPRVIFCEKPVVSSMEEIEQLKQLLRKKGTLLIPNLSRRWSRGAQSIVNGIKKFGRLEKIHMRYTRGIYNTGSHLFDLVRLFAGAIKEVRVCNQVPTSADNEGDPSFSFYFITEYQSHGFAEAFNDRNYYMFEMDLYFEAGKIEMRLSGDEIKIFQTGPHPLFSGFSHFDLVSEEKGLLAESHLKNAIEHIVEVLKGETSPICGLTDGVHPLYVAQALIRSHQNRGSIEQVEELWKS